MKKYEHHKQPNGRLWSKGRYATEHIISCTCLGCAAASGIYLDRPQQVYRFSGHITADVFQHKSALSTGASAYADYSSAEGQNHPPNEASCVRR